MLSFCSATNVMPVHNLYLYQSCLAAKQLGDVHYAGLTSMGCLCCTVQRGRSATLCASAPGSPSAPWLHASPLHCAAGVPGPVGCAAPLKLLGKGQKVEGRGGRGSLGHGMLLQLEQSVEKQLDGSLGATNRPFSGHVYSPDLHKYFYSDLKQK